MRYTSAIVGALAFCASEVVAFPAAAIEYAARAEHDTFAREDIEAAIAKLESQRRAPGFDAAKHGNTYKVIISQFQELFQLQPNAATANYDLSVLTPFRASRFQQSIERNPYFFNGPFSGIAVQPAAYTFIYRFMGNKSAEYPEGRLNQDVLKSFFSITGTSGNFQWTEGYERIPENWYKRAIGDEYTIPFFLTDLLAAALEYPQFLNIGGNTGKVNTFTGVNFEDLTGGVFNGATLLEGNNLACFVLQGVIQFLPDSLLGAVGDVGGVLNQLNGVLGGALSPLTCPKLDKVNKDQFSKFPGAQGMFK
ncbi:hypothetical protein DL95DRAFT_495896 [Leptodontidium sp. 2 PMI_412]|nr:hypothetical protein DL95DRAFT_495896 [Leptodontidium sp. 2 PMI_412]